MDNGSGTPDTSADSPAAVLVVGAGPTGLMLANQLARRGVRPVVIDRHDGPARETRALGVQARTLEIYQELGIAEQALALGRRAAGAHLWSQGRHAARVPLGDIGRDLSPFPFLLILGQDDNEALLGRALASLDVPIRWRTELLELVPSPDSMLATIRNPDGSTSRLQARWVAGCDGAHSTVRHLNGIGFPGGSYEQVFYVADTEVTGPMAPDELNVYLSRDGFHLFFPLPGQDHWRVVGILPPAQRGRDDGNSADALPETPPAGARSRATPRRDVAFADVLPDIQKQAGDLRFRECRWFSTYRIHHRRAERFRQGHCFLLGDAAHVHSPVGAQGMNTGLQDATNLAWKLALVESGQASESLLDSYAAEREPVAERLLATTDRAFTAIAGDNPLAALFRTRLVPRLLALAMSRPATRELAFRTISQVGIAYRRGPLSVNLGRLPSGAPRAGERFPWLQLALEPGGGPVDLFRWRDDRRFELLVFGEAQPKWLADLGRASPLIRATWVPGEAANKPALAHRRIASGSGYLIRPDGYIGLVGQDLKPADVLRYLSDVIGLRLP